MLAAKVYISDSDWHGTYNRTRPFRCSAPTVLGKNVWLGYRSIVGKGVSIGENSIVGAGSVVTQNVPSNVIVAGNPAKIVKKILPERKMLARDYLFQDGERYWQQQQKLDAYLLADNTVGKWLKTKICPSQND